MRIFKATKPKRKPTYRIRKAGELEALDRLASFIEANEPEMIRWLVGFWGEQENAISYAALQNAIVQGKLSPELLEKWYEDYSNLVIEKLVPSFENAMVTAVLMDKASGIGVLPATYYPSKDLFTEYLEVKGGELITSLTDTQHKAVNHMLTHLYADKNMGSVEASRFLRPLFGLNQPQMRANKNFYDATLLTLLENNPKMSREIGAEKALKKATAYAAKQHRYRATMIARTELANAYNAGHYLATVEAMAIGLLDEDMLKIVCTSDSERRCDSCRVMEGETVPIQEKFSNGYLTPPFHPQCMCTLLYEEKWLHDEFSGGGSENGRLPSGNSSTQGLTSPNNSGTMGSGGVGPLATQPSAQISGALNFSDPRAELHATKYYESVRKMKTDCKKISKNTKETLEFVQTVKAHLFMTKHDLGGPELEYFYPDYDIAQSWQRLTLSPEAIEPIDRILLNHEYLEHQYMTQGMSQSDAHKKANETYNYQQALKDRGSNV